MSEGIRLRQCEVSSCLCPLRPSVTYINGIESAGSYNVEGNKVTRLKKFTCVPVLIERYGYVINNSATYLVGFRFNFLQSHGVFSYLLLWLSSVFPGQFRNKPEPLPPIPIRIYISQTLLLLDRCS